MKEATARIKINKLLESAGWRFFAEGKTPANICLELSTKIKESDLDALGENLEKTEKGFTKPVIQFAQLFSFVRETQGPGEPYQWDEDSRLQFCVALSRLVQPSSVSLRYAANPPEDEKTGRARGVSAASVVLSGGQSSLVNILTLRIAT